MNLLRRNVAFLLFSQIATWLISLTLLVIAPDRFGAESWGNLGLAVAYVGIFTLVGSLGTAEHLVKQVARDPDSVTLLVTSALRLKLLIGLALSAVAIGLAFVIDYDEEQITLIAILCIGMILEILNGVLVGGLAGMERLARVAMWQTVQVYVGSIAAIVIALTTQSTVGWVTASALSALIPVVANYRDLRPALQQKPHRVSGVWKSIIVAGTPIFVLQLFNRIYSTIDVPLLEWISGSEVVGWYTLAYKWVAMPIFITSVVVNAFFPRMSNLAKDPEAFSDLVNQAVRLILLVNIPLVVGLMLVADDLITLLYGPEYSSSIQLIRVLAPFILLAGLNTVLATALLACDRHIRYLWVAGSAAVLNPFIAIGVIRWADANLANGAVGAAALTVVTEVVITVCALQMRVRGSSDRRTLLYAGRCLVAGMVMVPAVWVASPAGLVAEALAGAVAYGAASLALRTVTPSFARGLMADLRPRRGPADNDIEGDSVERSV